MPEPLSKLERRIFDYLVDYLRRNTYQPSIREIGRRFDIKSTKTVSEYLQALADKGWIERDPSRSRGVRLVGVDLHADAVTVPVYGAIAPEGEPLPSEAILEELTVDRKLAGPAGAFFLPMRGNSMQGAGLQDGDLLLVQPVEEAELSDGDIVVARLDGEPMVNRFSRRGAVAVLEPASPAYRPTSVPPHADFQVLGRVGAVVRRVGAAVLAPAGSGDRKT